MENDRPPQDIEFMSRKSARDVRGRFFKNLVVRLKTMVAVITTTDEKLKKRLEETEILIELVSGSRDGMRLRSG
jgi:hypothetical protein